MYLQLIKYLTIFFCCAQITNHILALKLSNIQLIAQSIFLAISVLIIAFIFPGQFCFFSLFLLVCITYNQVRMMPLALTVSLLSFSFVTSILTLCNLCVCLILYPFSRLPQSSLVILMSILSCSLALLSIQGFLRIRRFKSGMPFLRNKHTAYIGVIISLCCVTLIIYVFYRSNQFAILAFIFQLIVCLSLIPFIAWWRICIRKSYYTYLKNMELQELQLKIQTLTADNDRLSQLVHKDNKLLTAMTHSVYTLLEQVPNLSPEKLESQCSLLCEDLLCLSQHRQSTLQELSGSLTGQFYTGHMIIDSVLNMMFQQAKDKDISLSVEISPDFWANISSYLDEEELAHVIADLTQNAIIATQNAPVKHINFYFIISTNNIPSIQIADSGTPFPPIVLDTLGISRCSQHLHEGGSGIGLMDIWTLKSTTKATLLIEEFPSDAKYTKCIHFIFDQKNRYLIVSPRYNSLSTQISRRDVMIMSPQD